MTPELNRFFFAISTLLKLLGIALAGHGLGDSGVYFWVEFVSGTIMVLGPAAYDVWAAGANLRKAQAVGVQAGINLAAAGQALDNQGKPIMPATATAPAPVTQASASNIVQDYGPQDVPKAK